MLRSAPTTDMSDAPMFAGSVPENYDRYLRPLLFEPYALDLAGRLELRPAMRVQLLFNVWDALERDRIAQVTHDALGDAFPGRAPKFLTIPSGFHDEEVLQQLVSGAGFSSVRIERVGARGHSASAREAAVGLVTGSPMAGELAEARIPVDEALAVVELAIRSEYGAGPLDVPLSAVVVSARA